MVERGLLIQKLTQRKFGVLSEVVCFNIMIFRRIGNFSSP
jgi:hypothetical protein